MAGDADTSISDAPHLPGGGNRADDLGLFDTDERRKPPARIRDPDRHRGRQRDTPGANRRDDAVQRDFPYYYKTMSLKSPCIGVCKFEPVTGLCKACYRTRVEKRDWKRLPEPAQSAIVALRPQRESELAALRGASGKQRKEKRQASVETLTDAAFPLAQAEPQTPAENGVIGGKWKIGKDAWSSEATRAKQEDKQDAKQAKKDLKRQEKQAKKDRKQEEKHAKKLAKRQEADRRQRDGLEEDGEDARRNDLSENHEKPEKPGKSALSGEPRAFGKFKKLGKSGKSKKDRKSKKNRKSGKRD